MNWVRSSGSLVNVLRAKTRPVSALTSDGLVPPAEKRSLLIYINALYFLALCPHYAEMYHVYWVSASLVLTVAAAQKRNLIQLLGAGSGNSCMEQEADTAAAPSQSIEKHIIEAVYIASDWFYDRTTSQLLADFTSDTESDVLARRGLC